jgi:hypothetical protein
VISDPVLQDLTRQQTDLFNRDAPEEERVALMERIQKRQEELKKERRD